MSKRKREEFVAAILEMADRIDDLDQGLSDAEVDEVLEEGGCDPRNSWNQFLSRAKVLESDLWAKGVEPSLQLRRLIKEANTEATAPIATPTASAWLDALLSRPRRMALSFEDMQVARAYRKSGELSQADVEALDALEQELKSLANKPSNE
jgi:hypothetical protein